MSDGSLWSIEPRARDPNRELRGWTPGRLGGCGCGCMAAPRQGAQEERPPLGYFEKAIYSHHIRQAESIPIPRMPFSYKSQKTALKSGRSDGR